MRVQNAGSASASASTARPARGRPTEETRGASAPASPDVEAPPLPPGAARLAPAPRRSVMTRAQARADSPSRAYDEVHDSTGAPRPAYRDVYPLISRLTARQSLAQMLRSQQMFRGDNRLNPWPRILTRTEYETLKKGVEQRAKALRRFLEDHYSGQRSYQQIIPKHLVDRIMARTHEAGIKLRPDQIAFPYGPDVMRAVDGKFYVIEDNPGFIGGPGDLLEARRALFTLNPGLAEVLHPLDDPMDYYRNLVEDARHRAIPRNGKIVLYLTPPYDDHEHKRLRAIMSDLGVTVVSNHSDTRLLADEDGAYLYHKKKRNSKGKNKEERVGFIFLNGEHKFIDAGHPAMRRALLLSEADEALARTDLKRKQRAMLESALKPTPRARKPDLEMVADALTKAGSLCKAELKEAKRAKGLMDAILDGKVAVDYSPGVDFIGDKCFKGYVDDLVRFYLGEEPLLPSIPVHRFTRSAADQRVDPAQFEKLLGGEAYKNYVFKVVDGRGGEGVSIGPKMTQAEVKALRERIQKVPAAYVAEPYTPLSQLQGNIVDLRLLTNVTPDRVLISPTPWGRGVPVTGDGKVNLHQKGSEFAVVVVEDPPESEAAAPARAAS